MMNKPTLRKRKILTDQELDAADLNKWNTPEESSQLEMRHTKNKRVAIVHSQESSDLLEKIKNINHSIIDKVIANRHLARQNSENAFSNLHIRHVDMPDLLQD